MMAREPRRALTHTVMARVREDINPSLHRLVWITAAASVLICAAIAGALMSRVAQTPPSLPAAQPLAVSQPAVIVEPPMVAANDVRPTAAHRGGSTPAARGVAPALTMPRDVSPIEPLDAVPITLAAIDVPRLELEVPVRIEALTIEQLTIEPLAASND